MRSMLVVVALALLAGCTVPAATLERASVWPTMLQETGRLDDAHPEARLRIAVPADAQGLAFDLTWTSSEEHLVPDVTLLDAAGAPALHAGHAETTVAKEGGSYHGLTSGVWTVAPGEYYLDVGFATGFPAGHAFDVVLHASSG